MTTDNDNNDQAAKETPGKEEVRLVYQQICDSYRAIDDFRTKLLGFLPLVSSGIFLFAEKPENLAKIEPYLLPLGVFGFCITLGLFFLELYGIKKCTYLIKAGRQIEEDRMGGIKGQFSTRPNGILRGFIDEPMAAGVIYPAVLAVWSYLADSGSAQGIAGWVAVWVFVGGLLVSGGFIVWLKLIDKPKWEKDS